MAALAILTTASGAAPSGARWTYVNDGPGDFLRASPGEEVLVEQVNATAIRYATRDRTYGPTYAVEHWSNHTLWIDTAGSVTGRVSESVVQQVGEVPIRDRVTIRFSEPVPLRSDAAWQATITESATTVREDPDGAFQQSSSSRQVDHRVEPLEGGVAWHHGSTTWTYRWGGNWAVEETRPDALLRLASTNTAPDRSYGGAPSADSDADGVPDDQDACPGAPDQEDLDGDGTPAACDVDRDGDGVPNSLDAFPDDATETTDTDGDGTGDVADDDDDGDGSGDAVDADDDNDGVPDEQDRCPGHDDRQDLDRDGIPDGCDDDRDGDGVGDFGDAFPDDPREWVDTDGDGIGDYLDADDDNDGIADRDEWLLRTDPLDPDTDGDGLSDGDERRYRTDPINPDTDGDGVSDGDEVRAGTDPREGVAGDPFDALDRGTPGAGIVALLAVMAGFLFVRRRHP